MNLYLWSFVVLSLSFRIPRLAFAIRQARQERGQKAVKPIFWVMAISYFIYFGSCAWEAFNLRNHFSYALSLFGLILFLSALALRERAMRDLGRFFSPDIEIRLEHQVIREGLYRYLRHPLLACMGLEILGIGLVFNATRTLLIGGIGLYFPLIWIRKTLEEHVLIAQMGENYRAYMREVGAFVPHVFGRGMSHG